MICDWIIVYVMSYSYTLNVVTSYRIPILHYKIIICLNEHVLFCRTCILCWEYPLIIYSNWMPWSYYQVAYLYHINPFEYLCFENAFYCTTFYLLSFSKLIYRFFAAILHCNETVLMDTSSILVIIISHVNWCWLVYKFCYLLSSWFWGRHFYEYCIHICSIFFEQDSSIQL